MRSRLFHTVVVLGTSLATACGGSDSTETPAPVDAAGDAAKDGTGSDSGGDTADTFPTIKPPSDTGSGEDTSKADTNTAFDTGIDTFPGIKPPPPPDDAFPSIK